jgi:hypothetical protein
MRRLRGGDRIATRMITIPTRVRGSDAAPAAKISCWRFLKVVFLPSFLFFLSPSLSFFLFLLFPLFFSLWLWHLFFPMFFFCRG